MTDTSKVYVMPDGYIYAYIEFEKEEAGYTNLAEPLPDNTSDTTKWVNGYRISSSGVSAQNGSSVSNSILCKEGDKIRIKGVALRENTDRIMLSVIRSDNGAEGNMIAYFQNGILLESQTIVKYDGLENGIYTFSVAAESPHEITGFRFSMPTPEDAGSVIITVNEEIGGPVIKKEYRFANTGLAFIPADYESRIIASESKIAKNTDDIEETAARVSVLENGISANDMLPSYWIDAVDAIDSTVKSKQSSGADAFQFVWFSDMHGAGSSQSAGGNVGSSNTTNIGKVSQYLCDRFNIPLVATSGDIMSQASHTAVSGVYAEYEAINKILSDIDADKFIATIGNHDGSWGAPVNGVYYLKDIGNSALYNEVYRRQATDLRRVFGTDGTYFYIDSMPQKVRFIMLNGQTDGDGSSDSNGYAVYNSMKSSVYGTAQLEWLASTLNSVPEGFTVIAIAHQPLNTSKDGSLVAGVFAAYKSRTTYSGTANAQGTYWGNGLSNGYTNISVSCDFTNAKGEFAAFFHGHIHKDTIDTTSYSFPCISITTAGADVRDSNPVKRVPGTATETAMDIVTIDKASRIISMTRVGAGIDREISY